MGQIVAFPQLASTVQSMIMIDESYHIFRNRHAIVYGNYHSRIGKWPNGTQLNKELT